MKNQIVRALLVLLLITIPLSGAVTQGFFLNDFCPKDAVFPPYEDIQPPDVDPTTLITVNFTDTVSRVSKYIYGNNANVYMTQMITEDNLIRYIKLLSPHAIRYPGGNLSNLFFWNAAPGELPEDVPVPFYGGVEKRVEEQLWFGQDTSAKTLSVDNYYQMLEKTNSMGVICVNYSYGRYGTGQNPVETAAGYAADWVRYDNSRTKFWEIGNENYGTWQAGYKIDLKNNKDNQPEIITGELYGQHFNIFVDSMRAAARELDTEIRIGCVLLEHAQEWHTPVEKTWNSGFFKQAGNRADFFVIHSYYTPWNEDSSIPVILNSAAVETQKMVQFLKNISDENRVDMKPVALTEWNIFAVGSKQQVSTINGIHSVLVLGELIRDKFGMACRWNLANNWANGNDHGMFSQGNEPGVPRWNPRPVYFYMTYFQKYFGDHMVSTSVSGNDDVVAYGSRFNSGEAGIILINKGATEQSAQLQFNGFKPGQRVYFHSLTGGNDNDNFSLKVFVNGQGPVFSAGGPPNIDMIKARSALIDKDIIIELPAYSVQYILVETLSKDCQ